MTILILVIFVLLCLLLEYDSAVKMPERVSAGVRTDRRMLNQGEEFALIYTIRNTGLLPCSCVHISQYVPGCIVPDGSRALQLSDMRALELRLWIGGRRKREISVTARGERRGRYMIPAFMVTTGDFLGLREMPALCDERSYNEVVVCPKAVLPQNLSRALGGFLGDISVRRFLFEDPVLTIGFREYTGREAMRQISWTQSARGKGLMVKNPDHTASLHVTLLLDTEDRRAGAAGEFSALLIETAFSLARGVLEKLEKARTPYAFAMNAEAEGSLTDYRYIPEGSGRKHFESILEGLGRAGYSAALSGPDMMEECLRRLGGRSGMILVTLRRDDGAVRAFQRNAAAAGSQVLVIAAEEAAAQTKEGDV